MKVITFFVMKTIVHDDISGLLETIVTSSPNTHIIGPPEHRFAYCIGCFSCWIKTPGKCILPDAFSNMGERLGHSDELILISTMTYGGQSPFVKGILDRSIPYVLPFFKKRKGMMHHRDRYPNRLIFKVYFYGESMLQEEKNIAKKLVEAQALNLNAKHFEVKFFEHLSELKAVL